MELPFGTMPLILNDLQPWHWAVSGGLLGLIAVLMMFTLNTQFGLSTTFVDFCALGSRLPFFDRPSLRGSWRLYFALGLIGGGVLGAVLGGGWAPTWDLGLFDSQIGYGALGKIVWMFAGGLLIGLGVRIAGGCTSGHGIFGLATLQWASVRAVLSFMVAGILMANLLYRVIY